MKEKDIERRLKRRVETAVPGALCLKFVSPGYTGVPDRIILLPSGRIAFVELKAPGEKERPRQVYVQDRLRKMGYRVYSGVDSYDKIDRIVEELCRSDHTSINSTASTRS